MDLSPELEKAVDYLENIVKTTNFEKYTNTGECKNEWLNGCVRWTLQPVGLNKDGSYRPTETIDVEQLKVIGDGVKLIVQPSGGSKVGPVRHSGPTRR